MVKEIKDIGKVRYIGRDKRKQLDDLFEVNREEKREQIKEWRFRKEWKI